MLGAESSQHRSTVTRPLISAPRRPSCVVPPGRVDRAPRRASVLPERYGRVVTTTGKAKELAQSKLARSLPRRWRHVMAVAAQARHVCHRLGGSSDLLVAAAWLHDIGYAPDLVDTGFHPLDGARYLRRAGVDEPLVSLVAYHSCAQIEADVRGLGTVLSAEFLPGDSLIADALCYCDMTTSPDGEQVQVGDRLVEIRGRYGPDDPVTRFVELAAPEILATAGRVEELLASHPMYGSDRLSCDAGCVDASTGASATRARYRAIPTGLRRTPCSASVYRLETGR